MFAAFRIPYLPCIRLIVVVILVTLCVFDAPAACAKKKGGATVKAFEKEWKPHTEELQTLLEKARARRLFTPDDAKTLEALIKAGDSIQGKYATLEEGATVLYDLGLLYMYRERYFEAYDAFSTVAQQHEGTVLGRKSLYQINLLKPKMGDAFPEATLPVATAPASKKSATKK
jgi:hypothetical protein